MTMTLSSINLTDDGLLPVCEKPLWDTPLCEDDPASYPPAFWLVGAHGGAGCSVLAEMLAPAGDAGQQWPAADEYPLCVVVARATVRDLERAHQVVLQALQNKIGAAQLLGLAVVHQVPGKLPKLVRGKLEVLQTVTPVWELDYIPGLQVVGSEPLAAWAPSDEVSEKRREKKKSLTEQVPAGVAQLGSAVFQAARDAFERCGEES